MGLLTSPTIKEFEFHKSKMVHGRNVQCRPAGDISACTLFGEWQGPNTQAYSDLPADDILNLIHKAAAAMSPLVTTFIATCSFQGRIHKFVLEGRPLSFPLPSPPFLPPPLPFPRFALRSRVPLNQLEGLRERCNSPQRGPEQSPGRKRIWCSLRLRESHWWQSF